MTRLGPKRSSTPPSRTGPAAAVSEAKRGPGLRAPDAPPRAVSAALTGARAPRPRTPGAFAATVQAWGRRLRGPALAALLGAAALPLAPGAALAQGSDVGAAPVVTAPSASPAPAPRPWRGEAVAVADALERHLFHRLNDLRAMHAQYEAVPVTPEVAEDLLRLHEIVERVDRLVQTDGALPTALLVDLDHLLAELRNTAPGTLSVSLDAALRDLPSTRVRLGGLGAIDGVSIEARAPARAGAVEGPSLLGLRDLLSASPTDFPDRAQAVLQRYGAIMAGVDAAVSWLPDFSVVSPTPLVYDTGDGVLLAPPGARIVKEGDRFALESPGMLWMQDGLTVLATDGAIQLGGDLDGLRAARADAAGDGWQASLRGAMAGIDRRSGIGVVRADRLDLDVEGRRARLDRAELLVAPSGDAALTASRVSLTDDGFALDLEGLAATQTREGTGLAADRALLADDRAVLSGAEVDVFFGPDGARLTAEALTVTSGATTLELADATAALTPLADGGHRLRLTGDTLAVADGGTRLRMTDGAQADLTLDADGRLRRATFDAGRLDLATPDGTARLTQARVEGAFSESGHLTGLGLEADRLAFAGDDLALTGTSGRLDLGLTEGGRLSELTARAGDLALTTDDGRLAVSDGALDATFDAGRLTTAGARLGVASWRGSDGAAVDAADSRLDLAFHDAGGLAEASLEAGALDLTTAAGVQVSLRDGAGRVRLTDAGRLASARLDAGALTAVDGARRLELSGLVAAAAFDDVGRLTSATAEAGQLTYADGEGHLAAAGRGMLTLSAEAGEIRGFDLRGADLVYADVEVGRVTAAAGRLQGTLRPTDDGPVLTALSFDARDVLATGDYGRLALNGQGGLEARWTEDGAALSGLTAHADALTFTDADRDLGLSAGRLTLTMADDRLAAATATFAAGHYAADFGRLDLTGGTELGLAYDDAGGAALEAAVERLDLAHDGGRLGLDGGRAAATFAPDGAFETMRLDADHLTYAGTAEGAHPLEVELARPEATLTALASGGQRLDVTTGEGAFVVDGHRVGMDGLERLTLQTTPDGAVDAFTAEFAGALDFVDRDGDLSILARDLGASYDRADHRLALDFSEADVALRSEGLAARIEGGAVMLDDDTFRVRVDRAEVLRELGAQLNATVESLALDVTRGARGSLQTLDLSLGALDAEVEGLHAIVTTPAGERVRLHVRADEDGRVIQEAFLQIPEGGEVRVRRDDLDLSLGGQAIRFEQDDAGVYRLRAESLDVEAWTKDSRVQVEGGDAEISLDPSTGRLAIEHITGTRVDLSFPEGVVHVDLDEVRGFTARALRFGGDAIAGGALYLDPTADGSTLSAAFTGEVRGVPFELRFRDVHQLEALGQLSENQVHVVARDPSGQGHLHLGFGPVELEGSAIEVVGRYHQYDPGRMLESVSQFTTTSGADLFSGVSIEPDGVLRLGTDRDGLNGELAVLLPRTFTAPGYRFQLTEQPSQAPGVLATLGYRRDDVTFSAFGGLMPGSHATLHVGQGAARVAGVRVPDRTDLPTTVVGGLRLDLADAGDGQLTVLGGGYVNPAGLADTPYLTEQTPYGGLVGLEYRTDDGLSISAGGVLDLDRAGGVRGGAVQLRLGLRF